VKTKPAEAERRYQASLQLVRTADTIWNASRVFFAKWELSPSQFNLLNLLHSEPSGLSQTELSRHLIMHRSNVTGLIDRLEKRGLVQREDVEGDRRAYRVLLTHDGDQILEKIFPEYHAGARKVWDGLSGEQLEEIVAALQRVSRNAERIGTQSQDKVKDPHL
jgi:DNA-binding MarR family transcriptional regulator